MSRPYLQFSIDQLEAEYQRAGLAGDANAIGALAYELTFRNSSRAKRLRETVEKKTGANGSSSSPSVKHVSGSAPAAPTKVKWNEQKPREKTRPSNRPSTFSPTPQQEQAIELFKTGGSLKINAYAGTGKTSTLELLAHSTNKRGQYIAFNKSIVREAEKKFPPNVSCSTSHRLALSGTSSVYRANRDKCFGKINANQIADILQLKRWQPDKKHVLQPRSLGYLILTTIRRFAQSAETDIKPEHVPHHGSLTAAPESTLQAVKEFAVNEAKVVWARMTNEHDSIPLGHDGYLKLWALSKPIIAADFILLDEAQDTNPVVLDVLKIQSAQMIYVGDKYQQIYEWRGAVNAMEAMHTDYETFLTQSFRFGPAIASAATMILRLLGAVEPIIGNPKINSRIEDNPSPRALLARTNGCTIAAVIDNIDANKKPCLVGGDQELMQMLRGVTELKEGRPSDVPDFFGFQNWQEVIEFTKSGEGDHLQTFVNLVAARGEKKLMWALKQTVGEDKCDVVISTAHKAKGCEWTSVRLMDDFMKSQKTKKPDTSGTNSQSPYDPAELRLFYVALTRAKEILSVAPTVLSLIGRAGVLK